MPSQKPTSSEAKRLGAAILKFLEYHLENNRLAPDQQEGVGVAMQCLSLVFDATPADAKDIPDLFDTFNTAAGPIAIEPVASDEDKKKAEEFKVKGNAAMKDQKFQVAIEHYTEAIKLDKLSCVYYCNRAAAFTNAEKFHEALDDCKRAIAINEDYAKAFSRMGLIYSKLQFFTESVSCYETAIKLEPDNEGYKKNLEIVKEKEIEQSKNPDAVAGNAF